MLAPFDQIIKYKCWDIVTQVDIKYTNVDQNNMKCSNITLRKFSWFRLLSCNILTIFSPGDVSMVTAVVMEIWVVMVMMSV